jgi:hypothetical protein
MFINKKKLNPNDYLTKKLADRVDTLSNTRTSTCFNSSWTEAFSGYLIAGLLELG